ncbi:LptF/LptG family permease [Pelagibacterium xiamenense]|uniref:LptF/LptG family permease n=1 Tax=Pelagibacterium xiamenense TaxID=2901140 RepID=UPI001E38CBE8|nr:LptF/LptG family permease [Pelagibacterium xiamenense]MCD7060832.1 LptF/LptG family permease [Pelagibacterium xiamenense]
MDRLSRYLTAQFFVQALTIFLAGGALIWLMQLLRLFDLVSSQGQNILTLMGQSALTTPSYARSILYVCLAIGLVRGLRALQSSRELHTIHAAQRTPALWTSIAVFTVIGMLAVGAVAHWIEPHARRVSAEWSADIAADVVGRALVPGQFTELQDGLVFSIGGRRADGTLVEFFFDDTTSDTRRTYFADTARVYEDASGYQLILNDGAIQYESAEQQGLSQIAFGQYHISLASLIDSSRPDAGIDQLDTPALLDALARDAIAHPGRALAAVHSRLADGLRAVAFCFLAASLAGFPHGRRGGFRAPMELVILVIAFAEQAVSAFSGGGANHYIAPSAILAFAVALFAYRMRYASPPAFPRRARA